MKILAADQSFTSSGIIILQDGEIIYKELFKTDKKSCIFDRAWKVAEHIKQIADEYNPDIIAIEGLAFNMRGNATRDLAGLQFTIVNVLRQLGGYETIIIPPNTVKKFATGSGKAKKEQLTEALPETVRNIFTEEMGVKKTTGLADMTDAYWIGMTALQMNEN